MNNILELSTRILELVGGKDNIVTFAHCATRLRFNIKDKSLVKENDIKALAGIYGTQWVGEQLQIIVGQEVDSVYKQIAEISGLEITAKIDENLDEPKKFTLKGFTNELISTTVACVEPVLIVMLVGGFFKLSATLLGSTTFGILPDDHDIMTLLWTVGDCCFYYFPVFLSYTAAKRFGANPVLAMMLSGLLLHPTIAELMASGTFKVYGLIPLPATNYAASFLPALLNTYALSKIEKFFKKLYPTAVRGILYPFSTILVMVPLALCVFGPVGNYLGLLITSGITWLNSTLGPLATAIVGGFFPLLIVTGMHHAVNNAGWMQYVQLGYDNCIYAGSYFMDFVLTALGLACLIKAKKKETKARAISAITTDFIGGISEPMIFGFMLKSKRNILWVIIGGAIAGFWIGLMGVKSYVLPPCGIFSVLSYTGGSPTNFINGAIACALAFGITFALCMIFGVDVDEE